MAQIDSFPLCWPSGWKRATTRKNGMFTKNGEWVTVSEGARRIAESLTKMGIKMDTVIVSTNVKPRLDGLPRSGEPQPQDPGAAVYWRQRGQTSTRCMAIDRYSAVADNLAAIAATLEAMRAIERHGGAEILDRAFTGFKQLAAENDGPSWWGILQVRAGATSAEIETAYRALAKIAHPDSSTGSHEAMSALNAAREQGLSVQKAAGS
jgi:hypothetical protein